MELPETHQQAQDRVSRLDVLFEHPDTSISQDKLATLIQNIKRDIRNEHLVDPTILQTRQEKLDDLICRERNDWDGKELADKLFPEAQAINPEEETISSLVWVLHLHAKDIQRRARQAAEDTAPDLRRFDCGQLAFVFATLLESSTCLTSSERETFKAAHATVSAERKRIDSGITAQASEQLPLLAQRELYHNYVDRDNRKKQHAREQTITEITSAYDDDPAQAHAVEALYLGGAVLERIAAYGDVSQVSREEAGDLLARLTAVRNHPALPPDLDHHLFAFHDALYKAVQNDTLDTNILHMTPREDEFEEERDRITTEHLQRTAECFHGGPEDKNKKINTILYYQENFDLAALRVMNLDRIAYECEQLLMNGHLLPTEQHTQIEAFSQKIQPLVEAKKEKREQRVKRIVSKVYRESILESEQPDIRNQWNAEQKRKADNRSAYIDKLSPDLQKQVWIARAIAGEVFFNHNGKPCGLSPNFVQAVKNLDIRFDEFPRMVQQRFTPDDQSTLGYAPGAAEDTLYEPNPLGTDPRNSEPTALTPEELAAAGKGDGFFGRIKQLFRRGQ